MRRLLMGAPLLALVALFMTDTATAATTWKAVAQQGQATTPFRNSHSTAMAGLVEYHGLRKPNESAKTLVATCWMYAQYRKWLRQGDDARINSELRGLFDDPPSSDARGDLAMLVGDA